MAPVTFRADLLACRIYAALVDRRAALEEAPVPPCGVFIPSLESCATRAFDAAAAFAAELARRDPASGRPRHEGLPHDSTIYEVR